MNILFLLRYYPSFGGGESVTLRLAKGFINRGHKVYVMYLWDENKTSPGDIDEGIISRKVKGIHSPLSRNRIRLFDNIPMGIQLSKLINAEKIDIVINQWWPNRLANKSKGNAILVKCQHTMVKAKIGKRKYIIRLAGEHAYNIIQQYYWRHYYKTILEKSDYYVVLSKSMIEDLRDILKDMYERYEGRIEIISNPNRYKALENIGKKERLCIYVGRFSEEKRINLLVEAWKRNEKIIKDNNWRLILVGDGPLKEKINNMIIELDCCNIESVGFVDPYTYYERASFCLLTSSVEGFPMTLIEGMSKGCIPIVMNTFSTCSDLISDGKDGFLTENTIESFSDILCHCIQMDSNALEKNMLRCVTKSKEFELEAIIDKWESFMSRICKL